jgi:hypothetical protein
MGSHAQTLGHALPAARAILGGIRRRDGFYSLASVCCFAGEDGEKLVPASVVDRLVEARFLARPIMEIAPLPSGLGCGRALRFLL